MKLEIIKTKESDGDWLKVYFDGRCKACIGFGQGKRTEEEAMQRANEIYDFIKENQDAKKVLKSEEI